MRYRLTCWFGLLILALTAGLALLVTVAVEPADVRDLLLLAVSVAALVGLAGVYVLSAVLARQFREPVREMVGALRRVGEVGSDPRLVAAGDPELVSLAETFNDVSERLSQRVARLEDDRQQLRTVLSGMVEGVVALDADLRVRFANDRARELLEFHLPSPVGRALWELVRHRPLLDAVRNAQENAEPHREEVEWTGDSPRSLTVHAARLPGEPPRGIVLVLHDTTELRRLERLRQDFVANVSHELKTPLSVIKVCIETLIDGIDDVGHRDRFLEQISQQSDRLHALILDLLSLARIESGDEVYNFTVVPLDAVVRACVERHLPRAEARGQQIRVLAPEGMVRAWADEEAVDQILENLLDNALKYTPDGGRIEVTWRRNDQAVIEVSDTGIGIPEADLPRIFERFYRVDKARSREMGGTGLGLSIVKHLVQAMHGTVRATSRVELGTTFEVRLPVAG